MTKLNWVCCSLAVLMAAGFSTGCKKKNPTSGSLDGGVPPVSDNGAINVGTGTDLGTPGMAGEQLKGEEVRGQFQPVYFDYDSSMIKQSERAKIEAVAAALKSNSDGLIIEGNTDERGSNEYNLSLGERRALAVRAYLVGLGIVADRVQTKSFGEEQPADPGHGEAAWSKNRRAEFVLVK